MPTASEPLGGCLPSLEVEAKEEDELGPEGSTSIVDEEKGGGGANTGCIVYNGVLSKGASGSKKGLRIEGEREPEKYIQSNLRLAHQVYGIQGMVVMPLPVKGLNVSHH